MTKIRTILDSKAPGVWHVAPNTTVFGALELMAEHDIGAVPVVEDGRVVGILSERDYARRVVLAGKSSKTVPVSELMSTPVLYVRPDQTVADCMALMSEKRVRHLPVVDRDELVGIVTIGDVVREIIREQDYTIGQLENYITGSG